MSVECVFILFLVLAIAGWLTLRLPPKK